MSEQGLTQIQEGAITVSGTTAAVFYANTPMRVVRWGFTTTTALTTTDAVLTCSVTENDSTATVPTGAAAGGTLTVTQGAATDGAVNYGCHIKAENFGLGRALDVMPGERISFVSDGGPGAGAGRIWFEYEDLPFQDATRPSDDPGATQRATWLAATAEKTA